MTNYDDVRAMHEEMDLRGDVVFRYDGPPRVLDLELSQMRQNFMQEELDEYEEAAANGNLAEQFDALLDLVVVALGTAYLQGLPWQDGFDRVHAANWLKRPARDAEESKRRYGMDLVKPDDWLPPVLDDLVKS